MKIKEITESHQLDELLPLKPRKRQLTPAEIAKIQKYKEREARRDKPGQLRRKENPSTVVNNIKRNLDQASDRADSDSYNESQNSQKVPAGKPRNFVAKNMTTSGAGAHKDKKKAEKQGDVKHKGKQFDLSEDGEPMKIKAVAGNDVTIDQGGQEIKTTADALTPGQQPGTFTMKPADPNSMKPGATVTQDQPTAECDDDGNQVHQINPGDDGIHAEKDKDLMGSGHNHDIGGDGTDAFIQDVVDADFERAQRGGRQMAENAELNRMLTIAGLK